MRRISRLVVALILWFPVAAFAQTVTRAALVGTWVKNDSLTLPVSERKVPDGVALTLKNDGTWTSVTTINGRSLRILHQGRWYFSADTIWFGDPTETWRSPARTFRVNPPYKVVFQGQQVMIGDVSVHRQKP